MTDSLIERARGHAGRTAVFTPEGAFGYEELLATSADAAARLLDGRDDLGAARVCLLAPPGWTYVVAQWGIWRAGGIAVPLGVTHPAAELAHVLDDAEPEAVIVHPDLRSRLDEAMRGREIVLVPSSRLIDDPAESRGAGVSATDDVESPGTGSRRAGVSPLDELSATERADRPAMMLYTSGTTGRPKGVVISHGNIEAQVRALSEAWGWRSDDRILLHLPLHHVHGIVNVLTCALWNGATCEIMPGFDAEEVWRRLGRGDLTLYMAVPTVYRRLIESWEAADEATRETWSEGARRCRLMVSGSAALPVPTLERWREITGQTLLERYGMTEIGMALSNPLDGERRPGSVGRPLPGVEVELRDEGGKTVEAGTPGQIHVRGPTVFSEYWRRPDATAAAFTSDGFFRTGDQAVLEDGAYRILGRMSVDILKTGGEKISALEVEDVLRSHPGVVDCAVVGVPDELWGDRVCAAVVGRDGSVPEAEALRAFAKDRLAPYKVPKEICLVDDLPRNAMGKVTKPAVRRLFQTDETP